MPQRSRRKTLPAGLAYASKPMERICEYRGAQTKWSNRKPLGRHPPRLWTLASAGPLSPSLHCGPPAMPPPDWTKLDDVVVVEIARHLTRECIYPTDAMDGTLLDHARVARSNVNSAGSILATCKVLAHNLFSVLSLLSPSGHSLSRRRGRRRSTPTPRYGPQRTARCVAPRCTSTDGACSSPPCTRPGRLGRRGRGSWPTRRTRRASRRATAWPRKRRSSLSPSTWPPRWTRRTKDEFGRLGRDDLEHSSIDTRHASAIHAIQPRARPPRQRPLAATFTNQLRGVRQAVSSKCPECRYALVRERRRARGTSLGVPRLKLMKFHVWSLLS